MSIVFNERFSASRDTVGWTLVDNPLRTRKEDHPEGKWKKGDTYRISHQTYHGKLLHACSSIIDKTAAEEPNAESVVAAIGKATTQILKAIEAVRLG